LNIKKTLKQVQGDTIVIPNLFRDLKLDLTNIQDLLVLVKFQFRDLRVLHGKKRKPDLALVEVF